MKFEDSEFERSAFCGTNACVEVAVRPDAVAVRDSKEPQGPTLVFTSDEWDAFLEGVSAGQFRVD